MYNFENIELEYELAKEFAENWIKFVDLLLGMLEAETTSSNKALYKLIKPGQKSLKKSYIKHLGAIETLHMNGKALTLKNMRQAIKGFDESDFEDYVKYELKSSK